MKTGIKIFLIVIVVIGIAIAIYYYCSEIIIKDPDPIKATPFIEYVQKRVKYEIENKNISEACNAFNDIMGEISTEASVTLNNDKKLLSDNEVEKSKLLAFDAYAPIFLKNAIDYFKQSSWSDYVLNSNKKEAQKLRDMGIAEPKTQIRNSLDTVITTVENYDAAWKVIKKAKYCSTVAGIENLKDTTDVYKKKPYLPNNGELKKALGSVEENAKNAVINSLVAQCKKLSEEYTNTTKFPNYNKFYKSYENLYTEIYRYNKKYGKPKDLEQAKELLNTTDEKAKNYFNPKKDVDN